MKANDELLQWCLEVKDSVDYGVSLRWVFYRAVQGKGLQKKDWNRFKGLLSRARHKFYLGWRPDSLVDDTRVIDLTKGFESVEDWKEAVKQHLKCELNYYMNQHNRVIVCFEAQAMYSQFERYCKPFHVALAPFRGDASIPHKWNLKNLIEELSDNSSKVIVLYFGDYDEKGKQIEIAAKEDIIGWLNGRTKPTWIRVGLTKEQVTKYRLPENPDRPDQYQWEALEDADAKELIVNNLKKYVDLDAIEEIDALATKAEEEIRSKL